MCIRDRYASDCEKCTIRMLDTHKPTVDVTEVNNMSKVIDFDPRDFKAEDVYKRQQQR